MAKYIKQKLIKLQEEYTNPLSITDRICRKIIYKDTYIASNKISKHLTGLDSMSSDDSGIILE